MDSHRGHTHFECPVEVQTSKPLSSDEVKKIVSSMESEFLARRKILVSGLPPTWTNVDTVRTCNICAMK